VGVVGGAKNGGFVKLARSVVYVIVLLAFAFAKPVLAEGGQAGLIVVFGADDIHEACIALDDGPATGMSLLSRAGLGVVSVSNANGETSICRIADVGCAFPQEDCLCQCGDACVAWHYWVWEDGGWEPFEGSPTDRSVARGDVDAWVWGTVDDLPPELTDEGPCGPLLAMPQSVADDDAYPEPPDQPPPDEPYPGVTDEPGDESTPEPPPSWTPRPTATRKRPRTPSPTRTASATATSTRRAPPPSDTPTLERIEVPTEPVPPPTTTPPKETPDAGGTLVVRAATRGAATPTQKDPRPNPHAQVPAGRLGAAAGVLLAIVLAAAWWRWRQSRSDEPPVD